MSVSTMIKAAAIIVGVDGTPGADAALAWALDEARVRGSEVEAVVSRSMRVAGRENVSYDELTPSRCEHVLAESIERIGGRGGVPLRLETRDDGFWFELGLEATARHAGLVVIGAPSHGRLHWAGPRKTPPRLMHQLSCPVVIVPPTFERRRTQRIVVDLEWSGSGLDALCWAVGEAVLTGAAVEVVGPSGHRPPVTDLERRIKEILACCTVTGIGAAPRIRQAQDLAGPAPADLLVFDGEARHWQRHGFSCRVSAERALRTGVPVVLVPAGADERGL